ncbi:hypothetical protein [Endozoicomonas acroporae]|uniref:hypothetical protein n=1 Tax=Endozoicomonas acroporae TaxID=1701104 RepID=UPI003D7B8B77
MQPFSSTHVPLSDVTSNLYPDEPAKTNPSGTLGKFAVAVQSGITSFFSSLSPNYIPEHERQTNQPTAPVTNTLPADNKNDKTSLADNVVQGVGLASKALSFWVPNASAVGDAIGTICSYVSLANRLDDMAVSGKSGKPGKESTTGSQNVSKDPSQKVTDKKQEDEKPGKPVTASGTTNRVSGPAMATVTLMAMDRLAGAAAHESSARPSSTSSINATNTTTTPLPPINATITTTPLATAAMALPVTPAPLAGTISPWVVLGVSLGTAVTIVAGIGLCALYQHYHRREEAQQPAEPEIPLEHLNQQANN